MRRNEITKSHRSWAWEDDSKTVRRVEQLVIAIEDEISSGNPRKKEGKENTGLREWSQWHGRVRLAREGEGGRNWSGVEIAERTENQKP